MEYRRHIAFLFIVLGMVSCRFKDDVVADFANIDAAKNLKFQVIGQRETSFSEGLPMDCYLPDGTAVNAYSEEEEASYAGNPGPRRTNSTTAAGMIQELLKWGNQDRVIEIVGTYPSVDADGKEVTLSGKVMLPKGRKPKRMILVSHYTVGSNIEAPSNCFSLEGVLVKLGYGLVIPDYQGYGITAHQVHPYLVMDLTAQQVVDMYLAVRPWLKAVDQEPEEKEINLMGYSQGGATTMAVQYLIETSYNELYDDYIPLHRVFAGGGPYDVKSTYESFVVTDTASYPVGVPLVLQGMILGNKLNMEMTDMIQPEICGKMLEWINCKKYTTGQMNALIGTRVTHEMLTKEAMDQKSQKVAELYKAMSNNSIINRYWEPQAPVYMMHSIDDETVPFSNASHAKSRWENSNITYNFGHYGGHVKTCLRFIYSVQTLLKQEEKERKMYE